MEAVRRNWPGLLSIGLSLGGVALYLPAPELFVLGSVISLLVGVMAIQRARRRGEGWIAAVIGVTIGGTLTFLWAAWIVGIMLNPDALG